MTHREIVAQNFISSRGKDSLRKLLQLFEAQVSGEVIAKEFGVTRERVRQWRSTFGVTVYIYRVYPRISEICEDASTLKFPAVARRGSSKKLTGKEAP